VTQFGEDRLRGAAVEPTDEYFPGVYGGTRGDVRAVFERIRAHMGVDPDRVELAHEAVEEVLPPDVPLEWRSNGAAGHHTMRGGRSIVTIRDDQAGDPMALVATIAHELGHAILLGGALISTERKDHEPLTDLLTIYFGLGIFSANAAFHYGRETRGQYAYTRTSRLGYLTEPMYGYGLARYAWLRGETDPEWARYLDTNPRTFLKQGLRYLRRSATSATAGRPGDGHSSGADDFGAAP
jgi:hypothetical protein